MTQNKCLIVGSTEFNSGKSTVILGITYLLKLKGLSIAYGKPLGSYYNNFSEEEDDINFIKNSLKLSDKQVKSPLLPLNKEKIIEIISYEQERDYSKKLKEYVSKLEGDAILLEGAKNLWEGNLFNLSVEKIADTIDAPVLLISNYGMGLIDNLLKAKQDLDERLLGVIINKVPDQARQETETKIKPFLEKHGINILGVLPKNNLLQSVSVREINKHLGAKVLCCQDSLDLMVENIAIGAMNVTSALQFFRKNKNMAVVTGSDRQDLQLAALETSTNCLILTGHNKPEKLVLNRAEDLEIPILSVNFDTLKTVEIIEEAFENARLQEKIKVQSIERIMEKYFDIDKFIAKLGLEVPVLA